VVVTNQAVAVVDTLEETVVDTKVVEEDMAEVSIENMESIDRSFTDHQINQVVTKVATNSR